MQVHPISKPINEQMLSLPSPEKQNSSRLSETARGVIEIGCSAESPKSAAAASKPLEAPEVLPELPNSHVQALINITGRNKPLGIEGGDSQGNQKKDQQNDSKNPKSDEKVETDDDEKNKEDPTMFYCHGKWHKYSVKSLFIMNKHNKVRKCCVWLLTHQVFDPFIIFLIAVNSIMLGIRDYADPQNLTKKNQIIEISDRLFVSLFTLECIIKVIGMGFFFGKNAYLRESANWLDFVVVICSLLTEIPQLQSVSGLRTFRLMRPLRSLTALPSMRILISTLIASVAQLGGVLVLAIFFFTIFAILGVSLWSGQTFQRCRLTEFPVNGDWVADPLDTKLCSAQRPCGDHRWCGSLPAASRSTDPRYFIDTKKVNIYRDVMIPDLNYGYTNFDNLPEAFLTIFQCITLEGWIGIMHIYDNLFAPLFVDLFFLLTIVICSFFVLNLTIAVMLIKYEEFDKSEKSSTHVQDLYEYGEEIKLPKKFVEFVIDQDSLQISESGLKMLKSQRQQKSWKNLIKSDKTFDEDSKYYQNCRTTRICFHICHSPIFNGFIIIIIILNTVALAMDKHPQFPKTVTDVLDASNGVFTIIFTVEVVLKLIGFGVREYCRDRFNIFDAVIVIISILELALASEGRGFISALRALRLFRIFKLFRSGDLRTLIDSIGFTVLTIKDYGVLLALFIYVFALLGMSIFAAKVKFNSDDVWDPINGEAPRINFDTIGHAALTVFEIMIGENWTSMMYDHMRSDSIGPSSCVFFIALVCLGNVIMLNLFLAILLGNFDRARNFGEKKKIFDAFNLLCNTMDYQLNIAIAYLFNDQEFTRYIEEKILKIDEDVDITEKQLNQKQNTFDDHTETEIREVFFAMTHDKMEALLTGEITLGHDEIAPDEEELDKLSITELQRNRIIKILGNIKRQNSVRRQRDEFMMQVIRAQAERDMLEYQNENNSTEDDDDLTDDDDEASRGCFHVIFHHIKTSSLMIFPQNSSLRKFCQLCVISDDVDPSGGQNNKQDGGAQGLEATQGSQYPNSFVNQEGSESKIGKMQTLQGNGNVSQVTPSNNQSKNELAISQACQDNMLAGSRARGMLAALKKPKEQKLNVVAKIFEGVILTLIVLSSLTLALDNPLRDPASSEVVFMGYLDNCFTILFTLEAVIKIIALGFFFNNSELRSKGMSPYFRDPWNMLDFIVVVSSLLDFVIALNNSMAGELDEGASGEDAAKVAASLQSLKALRALRALRPLRMISRNQGMKLIVNALLSSLPSMTNVTILCLLSLLIFAILGVGFYKGAFGSCSITDDDILKTIKTMDDCLKKGGEWNVPDANFDNTVVAIQTLLEMMSTEGWLDVMAAGVDAAPLTFVGEGPNRRAVPSQPIIENNPLSYLYFVLFMIMGSQFILNLFVGVIMDNFNKIKEKEEMGSVFVTEDQRFWLDAHRLGLARKLKKKTEAPEGWRGKFYKLVTNNWFDNIITFFILINTLIMAIKYDGLDQKVEDIFENLNYFFAFVFNCEMFLKLIGLGRQYFYSAFDLFDMIVVIGTDLGIILKFTTSDSGFSAAAPVVRAFRIMRIVRLVRGRANIRIILGALVNILPQITNFITLMLLLLFVYAALGLSLFSGVLHQEYINEQDNFMSIQMAMLTLFRCSTGEDWNKIMHELSLQSAEEMGPDSPVCINDQDYITFISNGRVLRGCGTSFSHAYFLMFTVIVSWLFINLSVAAVIEGLEAAKNENTGVIEGDDVVALLDRWMEYDPKATGWLELMDFVCLLIELPLPFGVEKENQYKYENKEEFDNKVQHLINPDGYYVNEKRWIVIKNKEVIQILTNYKVKTYEGQNSRVHFKDVFPYFVKKAFKESDMIPDDFEISKHLKSKIKNQWVSKHKKVKGYSKSPFKPHHKFASRIIAKYVRAFKQRRAALIDQNDEEDEQDFQDDISRKSQQFGDDGEQVQTENRKVIIRHSSVENQNKKEFDTQLYSPNNNYADLSVRKSSQTQKFETDQKQSTSRPGDEANQINPTQNNGLTIRPEDDQPPVQQFNTFMIEENPSQRQAKIGQRNNDRAKKNVVTHELQEVGSQYEQSDPRVIQQLNSQGQSSKLVQQSLQAKEADGNERDSNGDENQEQNIGIALGQSISDSHIIDRSMNQLLNQSYLDEVKLPIRQSEDQQKKAVRKDDDVVVNDYRDNDDGKPNTQRGQRGLEHMFRREDIDKRNSYTKPQSPQIFQDGNNNSGNNRASTVLDDAEEVVKGKSHPNLEQEK